MIINIGDVITVKLGRQRYDLTVESLDPVSQSPVVSMGDFPEFVVGHCEVIRVLPQPGA